LILVRLAWRVWTGFDWLRTGIGGGLLWVRWWTFGFLRHGVSFYRNQATCCLAGEIPAVVWHRDDDNVRAGNSSCQGQLRTRAKHAASPLQWCATFTNEVCSRVLPVSLRIIIKTFLLTYFTCFKSRHHFTVLHHPNQTCWLHATNVTGWCHGTSAKLLTSEWHYTHSVLSPGQHTIQCRWYNLLPNLQNYCTYSSL
jgi:hypothetical protein